MIKIYETSFDLIFILLISLLKVNDFWRPPSLSELTPIIFDRELTDLGLEASIIDLEKLSNNLNGIH